MKALTCCAFALVASLPSTQQTSEPRDAVLAIEKLFAAMKASDSAAVRTAFAPIGRVVGMPPAGATNAPNVLTVDAFVAFSARNAPGSWDERIVGSMAHMDGTMATVWFDYEIYRNATLAQCGKNSVQLQRTGDRWLIQSMVFTAQTTGCTSKTHHP